MVREDRVVRADVAMAVVMEMEDMTETITDRISPVIIDMQSLTVTTRVNPIQIKIIRAITAQINFHRITSILLTDILQADILLRMTMTRITAEEAVLPVRRRTSLV